MIKIKHLFDAVERDDGQRSWIEPIGLTKDLRQWCGIDQVASQFGPPRELWEWFEDHHDAYEYFRGRYHEELATGPNRSALEHLARAAAKWNITLVHQGEDAQRNTATALYEFLSELQAYTTESWNCRFAIGDLKNRPLAHDNL